MSERIERLIPRAYQYGVQSGGFQNELRDALMGRALRENAPPWSHHLRRAQLDCAIFDGYPIEVDEDELLVGRYAVQHPLTDAEKADLALYREHQKRNERMGCHSQASTGHRVPDYTLLLNVGVNGLIARIDEYLSKLSPDDPDATEKEAFYLASKQSLAGFVHFAARAREALLQKMNAETRPARRAEYQRMADNFAHAPAQPCQNFYEALQCMWFLQFSLHLIGDTGLTGRIDRYLYPFYQRDIEAGRITEAFAAELVESLFLKHNEIYNAWPGAIMIGGISREGAPVWNALSDMCLKAIRSTRLVNPAVSLCYTPDLPDRVMDECVSLIADGLTRPAFFNDAVIQKGLRAAGVSEEDARDYIHSTCVEITPIGASAIQVATPYINLNKALEAIFNHGKAIFGAPCGIPGMKQTDLSVLNTFDDFYRLTCETVRALVRSELHLTCQKLLGLSRYASSPLASAFLHDCVERGKDCGSGGAKYSFTYPCFPGFINLVDSLAAIRCAVYDQRVMTLTDMAEMLKHNYEGQEQLRQYLIHRCPKFGNGDDAVDQLAVQLYNLLLDELKKYRNPVGAAFHPSYFAWLMHGRMGAVCGATPDGRRQGEALSECLGAAQGMDQNGPTGVLQSVRKIDQQHGIGGIATNLRFSRAMLQSEEGRRALVHFIRAFMADDCFEVQMNVVDQKTLLAARDRPEEYRTLMVRVAGFSDYFVNLPSEIQNELIRRNEHDSL